MIFRSIARSARRDQALRAQLRHRSTDHVLLSPQGQQQSVVDAIFFLLILGTYAPGQAMI
jgi:hypothetical protein